MLLWCAFVVRCYHAPIVIWQVSCASLGFMGNRGKGGRESGLTRGGRDRRRRSALRHFGGWQGRGGWDERPLQKKDRVPKKKKRRELLMFDRASLLLFCLVFFIACNSVCRLDSETHLHSARQGTESIRGRDERESKEGGEARKGENRAKSVNLPFSFFFFFFSLHPHLGAGWTFPLPTMVDASRVWSFTPRVIERSSSWLGEGCKSLVYPPRECRVR